MTLRSLNMAGNTLGTALSLLFLASVTQGLKEVEMFCDETVEAVVGQNALLPCNLKDRTDLKIASTEWKKKRGEKENTKLALYNPRFGFHHFKPNVCMKNETNNTSGLLSFPIYLSAVTKWDSGTYFCDITSFPFGSLRCKIELKVKYLDKIVCDVNSTIEAQSGENVIIHCMELHNAQYMWTKNNTSKDLVSMNSSLELWQVTEAHAGVYTLTVITGRRSLHKEFNISVLTVTTSMTTGVVTMSPQPIVTTQGSIGSTDDSLTSSPTTVPSTTWTMSIGTDVADPTAKFSDSTITAEESTTPFTNDTNISVTSSTSTFTPTQDAASEEMKNESTTHLLNPDNVSSMLPEESSTLGNISKNYPNPATQLKTMYGAEAKDNERSHLLVLIMFPALVLITVVGFLIRRRIIKQRMDLPPPFKPPPPPVRYAAAVYKCTEISVKSFPISRCNSVAEFI